MELSQMVSLLAIQRNGYNADLYRMLVPKKTRFDSDANWGSYVPRGDGTWGNVTYTDNAGYSYNSGYADTAGYAYSSDYANSAGSAANSSGDFWMNGNLYGNYGSYNIYDFNEIHCSKIYSTGGVDPPYVLYDANTREALKELVLRTVSAEKQTGAALYFNKITKKLEMYIASEDKYYDIFGNEIQVN